uniref:Uncharacterized protein n=1 Tax=Anguilla anguilla TaxID=7936 RepID=A0A0E9UZ84_ANGAN
MNLAEFSVMCRSHRKEPFGVGGTPSITVWRVCEPRLRPCP